MINDKLTVVITGGLGFIGSNMVEWLGNMQNVDLTIVDNMFCTCDADKAVKLARLKHIVTKFPKIKIVKDDFKNYDLPEGTDIVIHLAAHAGVRRSIENKHEYIGNNAIGTELLMLKIAALDHKPLLINASSSSVYGNSKSKVFSETDTDLEQISPYAKTKYAAEKIIDAFCTLYDLSAISLRFFTVYGPGMRPDLAICKFTRAITKGETIELYGDGTTVRDYTYVDDICHGIYEAMVYGLIQKGIIKKGKGFHEVFNLCSGKSISLDDMVKTIQKYVGKKAKVKYVDRVEGDVDRTLGSYKKALTSFKYKPKMDFKYGIKAFCEWYRENGKEYYGE